MYQPPRSELEQVYNSYEQQRAAFVKQQGFAVAFMQEYAIKIKNYLRSFSSLSVFTDTPDVYLELSVLCRQFLKFYEQQDSVKENFDVLLAEQRVVKDMIDASNGKDC